MGKRALAFVATLFATISSTAWLLLFAVTALSALSTLTACGSDPSEAPPDAGSEPLDPCKPRDLVGFCPPRGVHNGPLALELNAPEDGDEIHYTLDGSEPTADSPRYPGAPLSLSPDPALGGVVTVRAFAIHADGSRTASGLHSYVFAAAVIDQPALPAGHPETWGFGGDTIAGDYEMDDRAFASEDERAEAVSALRAIPSVSLVLDHDDLWQPSSGIYMRPSAAGDDFERATSFEILYPDGTGAAAPAGLRIQGGSSTTNWKSAKLSMRLKFNGTYGAGALASDVFDGEAGGRFVNLILDAHLNNTWTHPDAAQRERALYVHDQFVAASLNRAGSLAPRTRPVHLFLNGLYWGLYDLHERPDEHFAASTLGGEAGDWDVLRHDSSTVVAGDATRWNQMFELARAGLDDGDRYAAIGELLDIEDLITYMLINFYAGNDDWDHHNWYAIGKRTGDARFRFLSWDAERVLMDVNIDVTGVENSGAPSELYQALLASSDFRARLAARAAELYGAGGTLYVNDAAPDWDPSRPSDNQPARLLVELTEPLASQILLESARWGDNQSAAAPYTRADWSGSRDDLLGDYFPVRSQRAAAQLPPP